MPMPNETTKTGPGGKYRKQAKLHTTPESTNRPEHPITAATKVLQRGDPRPSKTVAVGSAVGLHARPAALIAEAVGASGATVTLAVADGEPVDAGSALMIMTLGAAKDTEVTIESDDADALAQVAELVDADLDASPDVNRCCVPGRPQIGKA